MTKNICFL